MDEAVAKGACTADEVVPEAAFTSTADEVVPEAASTVDDVVPEAASTCIHFSFLCCQSFPHAAPRLPQFPWIQQTICAGTDDPDSDPFCQGYTLQPTSAPTVFDCEQSTVGVAIATDEYPFETTWTLVEQGEESAVASGGPYNSLNTLFEHKICLPAGAYTFTIEDSGGDGICCAYGEGSYEVSWDGELVAQGSTFGFSESVAVFSPGWPTAAPTVYTCDQSTVEVAITTDGFPGETTWILAEQGGGEVAVANGGPYNVPYTLFEHKSCLPTATYTFTIFDAAGDGICCALREGSYEVKLDGELVAQGGAFESEESATFPLVPTASPRPTGAPTAFECDQSTVRVAVTTDGWPGETSWSISNEGSSFLSIVSPPYNLPDTLYEHAYCLPPAAYTFAIVDFEGDGICCEFGEGSYEVSLDEVVVAQGGVFADFEETTFGSASPTASPGVSAAPTPCVPSGRRAKKTKGGKSPDPCPKAGKGGTGKTVKSAKAGKAGKAAKKDRVMG